MFLLVAGTALAQESSPAEGRALAATCANCHGTNGIGMGAIKSLAGRPKDELAALLREFKSGKREGTLMPQLARGYTDEQIAQLSNWFAAQKAAP